MAIKDHKKKSKNIRVFYLEIGYDFRLSLGLVVCEYYIRIVSLLYITIDSNSGLSKFINVLERIFSDILLLTKK